LVAALPISYLYDPFVINKKSVISCRGSSSWGISICAGVDHSDTRCLIRAQRGGCMVMVFETDFHTLSLKWSNGRLKKRAITFQWKIKKKKNSSQYCFVLPP